MIDDTLVLFESILRLSLPGRQSDECVPAEILSFRFQRRLLELYRARIYSETKTKHYFVFVCRRNEQLNDTLFLPHLLTVIYKMGFSFFCRILCCVPCDPRKYKTMPAFKRLYEPINGRMHRHFCTQLLWSQRSVSAFNFFLCMFRTVCADHEN